MSLGKPRIVIYGVGQFGTYITRMIVERGWPIVAAFNRAGSGKVGVDLGQLTGLGRELGVVVQDSDTASYQNLDADLAIVTTTDRLAENLPAYRRLMGAGLKVLCHGAESNFPWGNDAALAMEIDRLAKENNVTFTGSGVWDTYRIWTGILATGPCTEIRSIFHESFSDASCTGKELMLAVGVGMTPGQYQEECVRKQGLIGGYYKTVPHHVLTAMGLTVTETSEHREPVLFDTPVYCEHLGMELQPGTVVGTRIVAKANSREGVSVLMHHEGRLARHGETEYMFWQIDGKPSVKLTMHRDMADTVHLSSASIVKRIRDVIAAPSGIRPVSQLGPLRYASGART
ncbi:MAG: hypothetical protein ABW034_21870 [Steroidobacteraceae bacterium]